MYWLHASNDDGETFDREYDAGQEQLCASMARALMFDYWEIELHAAVDGPVRWKCIYSASINDLAAQRVSRMPSARLLRDAAPSAGLPAVLAGNRE